jgi:ADP-heptose:LPS heptosyltransferase
VHIVEIVDSNPLDLPLGDYVCLDVNAGEMLACGYARVRAPDEIGVKLFDASKDWNGERVLFVRPGGFGDLLFLTPTLAELKRRWPELSLYVACFDRFKPALEHNRDVTGFVSYPVPLSWWRDVDCHIFLENVIEGNPAAEKGHAVDLVAARCGIQFETLEARGMRYFVTKEEAAIAERDFPRWPDRPKRIGIQVSASGRCRIYPHILEVARLLWRDGHEVFLFGAPGEVKTDTPEGIVNLMQPGKSFRESCAILATCDVLVGPDSALVHVAGALGVACVALYGPFPWRLRTAYAPETFALQGAGPCAPCFHHARPGQHEFPTWGPCARTGRCEVLAAITPERVVREVAKRLELRNAERGVRNTEMVI